MINALLLQLHLMDLRPKIQIKREGVWLWVFCNHHDDFKNHFESKQEGVKYLCDKCDYAASRKEDLRRHIKGKYENVSYPCPKCDYTETLAHNLKRHTERKHDELRHQYNEWCCVVTTERSSVYNN